MMSLSENSIMVQALPEFLMGFTVSVGVLGLILSLMTTFTVSSDLPLESLVSRSGVLIIAAIDIIISRVMKTIKSWHYSFRLWRARRWLERYYAREVAKREIRFAEFAEMCKRNALEEEALEWETCERELMRRDALERDTLEWKFLEEPEAEAKMMMMIGRLLRDDRFLIKTSRTLTCSVSVLRRDETRRDDWLEMMRGSLEERINRR